MTRAEIPSAETPAGEGPATTPSSRHYVWDVPTRLFHWLLVALLGFSWWSADNDHMDWHYKSGLTIFALVVFRLLWGLVGTSTSRFRHFVKGPRGVWSYVRGEQPASIGHNPLGGWSVVALLLALIAQVTSGLFTVDVDGIESGPLSHLVSFDQGRVAANIHDWSFNVLLGLVILHVVVIFFYLVIKRRNLIRAMVTGYEPTLTPVTISRGGWIRLLMAIAVAGLLTWWIAGGATF